MKLIVGLGNPGTKYKQTRHNVGFMVVDVLAKELGINMKKNNKLHSIVGLQNNVILAQPQTFMNNSGLAIKNIIKNKNLNPQDILIIFDDIDMEVGKIRFRKEGSSGGHRGMQSIIDYLQTSELPRIKIGIGRSETVEPNKYVTSKFSVEDLNEIKKALPKVIELIKEKHLNC